MSEAIVNKIAQSGIITLDLSEMRPKGDRVLLDIAPHLWQGIALKEKDFRQWVKETDWTSFKGKHVAVTCSADAIIPSWAFMLLGTELTPYAATLFFGDLDGLEELLFKKAIEHMDLTRYKDARIMLKGCGDKVPSGSYLYLTSALQPVVKSLMFGEPCSAVPVFKKKA